MIRLLFLLILLSGFFRLSAQQIYCVDSTLIRYGFYCNNDYLPVCGCDNKTYRNSCFAVNFGLTSYMDGICEPIALDIYKNNPAISKVFYTIVTRYGSDVKLYIVDTYGRFFLRETYPAVNRLSLETDVYYYPMGIYAIIVESNGKIATQKFVKFRQ